MALSLEGLQNKREIIESGLSNAAYSGSSGAPSYSDLSKGKQISSLDKQMEDLRSKQLRNRWYGLDTPTSTVDTGGSSDGWFMKGLTAAQKPLNAIMGAVQYGVGKGTESSLTGNVNSALKSGLTAGNVLQQMGVNNRLVQVPLGFALDVALDPVSWLTAGTSALIPRVGTGLVKGTAREGVIGGLKAAKTGLTSSLEKKAADVMNFVPFVKKIGQNAALATEEGMKPSLFAKGAQGYTDIAEKLGQKAIAGAEKYDSMIGKTVYDNLGKDILGIGPAGAIGDLAEKLVKKIPSVNILGKATPSGEKIVDFMKYSTKEANQMGDIKDLVEQTAEKKLGVRMVSPKYATFQNLSEWQDINAVVKIPITETTAKTKKLADNVIKGADDAINKVPEFTDVKIRNADGSLKPEFFGATTVAKTEDNARSILDVYGETVDTRLLTKAYKTKEYGKIGVRAYDEAILKLKDTTLGGIINASSRRLGGKDILQKVAKEGNELISTWNSYGRVMDLKPFEKILNAYPEFISLFKSAKVAMNPSSNVIAQIGNFFMGAMMGLPVHDVKYLNSVRNASKLMSGKLGATGLHDMFFADLNNLADMMENHPNRFRQLTGTDPSEIYNKLGLVNAEGQITGKIPIDEVKKIMTETWNDIIKSEKLGKRTAADIVAAEKAGTLTPLQVDELKKGYSTGTETMREMAKTGPVTAAEEASSWSSIEITDVNVLEKIKNSVAQKLVTNPNNIAVQAANLIVNKMPKWYEHIDLSWKIVNVDYLTKVGLNEEALLKVGRQVGLTSDDVFEEIITGTEKKYLLKPLAATEVAMEAFMNYSAMPDFVKITRALPVVGSSFFSFPYAMAVKIGKTSVDNPAIFNKVAFMMNEMNAARTPEEKAAMESKYNEYLKSPTIVKMFGMWNTNVKNLIPYYSMNMFNPSERNYDTSSTPGKIFKLTDKLPFFQDPIGQVVKDYMIQPWMLSGTNQIPQGQFGQPIVPSYDENGKPIDPTFATKALYATRAAAESVVPGSLGFLGIANAPLNLSPETINLIPSYSFRGIANATQGRSSLGAMTKEDAVRKTLRTVISKMGIPAYNLDTSMTLD